jgi:hypothetical protein
MAGSPADVNKGAFRGTFCISVILRAGLGRVAGIIDDRPFNLVNAMQPRQDAEHADRKTLHQEHVASYYAATRNDNQQWPELSGELNAEVCIIGGGFTGLNTAINLAEAGYKVVLLEANRIGWGASGRNGGQLIRGIGHDTSQFARWIGERACASWI